MCPDPQTLSAFFDGELSSHWVKEVEAHLSNCSECQNKISRLQKYRETLHEAEESIYTGSMDRVWNRLKEYREQAAAKQAPLITRRIQVPLPLAAAAVALLVLLGFSSIFLMARGNLRMMKIITEPSGSKEIQVAAPIEDLEVILKSLDSHGFKKETLIELPGNSQFIILGEPVLLRADEFTRSTMK